jgi:hypothetical protein
MSTTAESVKPEAKKASRKKNGVHTPKKTPARRPKKSNDGSEGPMPGKKLLQSWVDEEYHRRFAKMAADLSLRPATYLRQLVHRWVDEAKAAKKEIGS